MATTATRTWTGTPLRPTYRVTPHNEFVGDQCDNPDPERCSLCNSHVVEVPIQTADGRTVIAYLTLDQADDLADQIKLQAELARVMAY